MSVAVVVPYRAAGCVWRERARHRIRAHYAEKHGGWEWVEGTCAGDWSKGLAVADALTRTDADTLVISDADVFTDPAGLRTAVEAAQATGWAVAHLKVLRLSQGATESFYAGAEVREWDRNPYRGVVGGGLVVITRNAYLDCPIDPRFLGWGGEDVSWGRALNARLGSAPRGTADLWHLWHPTARVGQQGSNESQRLAARWSTAAKRQGPVLAAMIAEAQEALLEAATLPSLTVLPAVAG